MTARHDTYIERAPKNRDNPYGMLRRAPFDGSKLSWEARGMLAYILMKPDNWKVNISDLIREGNLSELRSAGRDKTYAIVNELIDTGYAERIQLRDDNGNFVGTIIRIHEEPLPEMPDTDLPETVEPNTAKAEHNNNGSIPKTDLETKTDTSKGATRPRAAPHPMTKPIIDAYVEKIGYTPTPSEFKSKIGPDAKHIAKQGHTPEDVRHAYDILQAEPFWQGQTIPLSKILGQIEKTKATIRNRKEGEDGRGQDHEDDHLGGWTPEEIATVRQLRREGKLDEAGAFVRAANKRRGY